MQNWYTNFVYFIHNLLQHSMTLSCSGPTPAASDASLKAFIDRLVMTRCCAPKVRVKDVNDVDILGIYQGMKRKEN